MIKLTFLGTSGAIPTKKRNHTSMLLKYSGENILIDCGEGTQRQFKHIKGSAQKLTRLLITHWHGDHTLGIPGLFQTLSFSDYNKTLMIYGPKGIKKQIANVLKAFPSVMNIVADVKIKVEEVSGKFLETDDFYIEAKPLTHGKTPTNAYVFVKKGKLRIDKKKLSKTKLPSGPLMQRLKQGKDVFYKGKKYKAKDLTYSEGDKKVSFVFDTNYNNKISGFVKDSDLIVSESTYESDLKEMAKDHGHLTASQAGEIAKKSNSKKLALIHVSERYEKDFSKVLKDAKKKFKNVIIPKDFDSVEI